MGVLKDVVQILAIDPGDVHVGWAHGVIMAGKWYVKSGEWTPEETVARVQAKLGNGIDELVVEKFVLYADKAAAQTWSAMKTPELIGKLKLLAELSEVEVVEQGAYIKKPVKAQMKARGIETSGGKGGHANDAILHLWYRILKEGYK